MGKSKVIIFKKNQKTFRNIVIYVPGDMIFPLSERVQEVLDKMVTVANVYLVFPKSVGKQINVRKFSTLYSVSGYYISPNDSQIDSVTYFLAYWNLIMQSLDQEHVFYTVLPLLDKFTDKELDKFSHFHPNLVNVPTSEKNSTIFPYSRISADDLGNIYCTKPKYFEAIFPDISNQYWTHAVSTETKFVCLSGSFVSTYINYTKDNPDYLESFVQGDRTMGDILSSFINQDNYLLEKHYNVEIFDIL